MKRGAEIGITRPQAEEHQEAPGGARSKGGFPLKPSERAGPCQHLDFVFLASRTVREPISVLKPHIYGHLLWQLKETNTEGNLPSRKATKTNTQLLAHRPGKKR